MDNSSMAMAMQTKHGIMSEDDDDDGGGVTLESSSMDSSSTSTDDDDDDGPLYEMSNLLAQLPLRKRISKFYQGKSQSFTCLSKVRSLEELAKPERPFKKKKKKKKKLRSSESYGGGLDREKYSLSTKGCSKIIAKKGSRGTFSSLLAKRHNYVAGRPCPFVCLSKSAV